ARNIQKASEGRINLNFSLQPLSLVHLGEHGHISEEKETSLREKDPLTLMNTTYSIILQSGILTRILR
ncbi:hypothetical protein CIB84_012067, partial [Bambusicola thoracicus]